MRMASFVYANAGVLHCATQPKLAIRIIRLTSMIIGCTCHLFSDFPIMVILLCQRRRQSKQSILPGFTETPQA
jgi:hypothetical protein